MKVIYPGSFDPVTNGHLDIIKRCAEKFDELRVVILDNSGKKAMFSCDEKLQLLKEVTKDIDNVEVDYYSGLLVDYAKQNGISMIVKGLRAFSDFEYELQMASMNKQLDSKIETFFLMTNNKFSFLSSSMVKEVAKFNGDISEIVPEVVEKAIRRKIEGV